MSKLMFYRIPKEIKGIPNPDWYSFRETGISKEIADKYGMPPYVGGIGGSEISSVIGCNSDAYRHAAWLFNLKTGNIIHEDEMNENMFWGLIDEDNIAEMWKYAGQEDGSYVKNYMDRKQLRNCHKVNSYAVNPKHKWLFASVDRLIDKGQPRLDTGEILKNGAILEIKHLNNFVIAKFDDGIPIDYKLQVILYMIVYEMDYAEFAIRSGKNLRIHIIEKDKEIEERILDISYGFWHNRVLKGREVLAEMNQYLLNNDRENYEKYKAFYHRLEPLPDETDAYKAFMKEIYRREITECIGTEDDKALAEKYKYWGEVSKEVEKKKQECANMLKNSHYKNACEYITFGNKAYSRYYENSRKTMMLDVKLPDLEIDMEEIKSKIDG